MICVCCAHDVTLSLAHQPTNINKSSCQSSYHSELGEKRSIMRFWGLLFLLIFIKLINIFSISVPTLKFHSFTLPHLEEPSFLRKFRFQLLNQEDGINIEEKFSEEIHDYDNDDIERDLENNLKNSELYTMKTEIFDANLEDVYRSVCDLEYYPSWSGNGIKSIKLV